MHDIKPMEPPYSNRKCGFRDDLNLYVRSSWEANYARYLNLLQRMNIVVDWQYEPETFWFEGIKRGTVSYKPDFRIFYKGDPTPEYVEVKGWTTAKDKTKWARMKKYHPHIKLTILNEKAYRSLKDKWSSAIAEWEFPARRSR